MINQDFNTLLKAALDLAKEQAKADGCDGCAFYDRDEWEMPCKKCNRNCRDYWRKERKDE